MNEIERLMNEYRDSDDIFEGDDEIKILREAIYNLPTADRIIFLLYAERQSLRDVGKELGVSHTVIYKQIKMIRGLLREWIEQHYPNANNIIRRIK